MKTLQELCYPRDSIFNQTVNDEVLDLTNLIEGTIDPEEFFNENFITEGMDTLLNTSFERFAGKSSRGLIRLTQSMGGGKTHNMIALGLLSKYPEYRERIINRSSALSEIGEVEVIAFTGRQSDAPYGIWGSIAEQLGKKEFFNDYYSPLKAPGLTAWINLLKGTPKIILFDELPPYLENAKSVGIGNTDLSVVTVTALSNLFTALNKPELSNVLVVISDLKATYQTGSALLQSSFNDLDNEINRGALDIVPVNSTSDEIYKILKTRIFKHLPSENEIVEISNAYKEAVSKAKQMNFTTYSPEKVFVEIQEFYPFHPSIKPLYERFKENVGFQQTRGIIRLMRLLVKKLYSTNKAKSKYLINVFDFDLNDSETLTMISQIKPSLIPAISHDIANNGRSIAETIDSSNQDTNMQDLSKLLLVSSLADIPNALLGLPVNEIISYLCEPNRDIIQIKKAIDQFLSEAWYIHTDKDGRFFFQQTKNLIAELNSLVNSFDNESAKKELRKYLEDKFKPIVNDCYQKVLIFPAIDEINLQEDKTTLVLYEPYAQSSKINPILQQFFDNAQFKNRVMFLSGERDTMDNLFKVAKEFKAIYEILKRLREANTREDDPQFKMANDKEHKINLSLLSSARETFMKLYYPTYLRGTDILQSADFLMEYSNNSYNGEDQVRKVLVQKFKFKEQTTEDDFRTICEQSLFTQKEMSWSQIRKRAATSPMWLWHHPRALDDLKDRSVRQGHWRDKGSDFVEKGPFPPEKTAVIIQQLRRDSDSGEVTLKIVPKYGDIVYFEIDGEPTTASQKVESFDAFTTTEMRLSFLCVDSKGTHETGNIANWSNIITLKHRIYDSGDDKIIELKAAPQSTIKYTTDGSDPKESGGIYDGEFCIPQGSQYVLAIAENKGIFSEKSIIKVDWDKKEEWKIDKTQKLDYERKPKAKLHDTKQVYEELNLLKKHHVQIADLQLTIELMSENQIDPNWLMLSIDSRLFLDAEKVEKQFEQLRENYTDMGNVNMILEYKYMLFPTGQNFLDWIADNRIDLNSINKNLIKQFN